MKKCKVCGTKTEVHFNIKFKAVPICESCGTNIFAQQAIWYARQKNNASGSLPDDIQVYNAVMKLREELKEKNKI